jgi:hypothetical protein
MKTVSIIACLLLLGAALGSAQTGNSGSGSSIFSITFDNRPVSLQESLYPSLYATSSVSDDLAWVDRNDSALTEFARQSVDSIFMALSAYSGIAWRDSSANVLLVRYYPSPGTADPLILPLGGIRVGALSEAIPAGAVQKLQLIYLLAHRILLQGLNPNAPTLPLLSNHPLMEPTPFRRDNLAFLLALAVSNRVQGQDSTRAAYQSPFWKRHLPGQEMFGQYLYRQWTLTNDRPLTRWLAEEVADSKLVEMTEVSIDQSAPTTSSGRRPAIEGVSSTGRLGFSVRVGAGGLMSVDRIDSARAAFRSGLRSGDVIRTVDTKRPKNQKELIELILDQLDAGGAMLGVTRNGKSESVFLRPGGSTKK